jgi:hypothetical protein
MRSLGLTRVRKGDLGFQEALGPLQAVIVPLAQIGPGAAAANPLGLQLMLYRLGRIGRDSDHSSFQTTTSLALDQE